MWTPSRDASQASRYIYLGSLRRAACGRAPSKTLSSRGRLLPAPSSSPFATITWRSIEREEQCAPFKMSSRCAADPSQRACGRRSDLWPTGQARRRSVYTCLPALRTMRSTTIACVQIDAIERRRRTPSCRAHVGAYVRLCIVPTYCLHRIAWAGRSPNYPGRCVSQIRARATPAQCAHGRQRSVRRSVPGLAFSMEDSTAQAPPQAYRSPP